MVEATKIPLPAGYGGLFARWQRALAELPGAILCRRAQATGRVIVGLGHESPSGTASPLHHTFGAPSLPGRALKGLAAVSYTHLDVYKRQVQMEVKPCHKNQ